MTKKKPAATRGRPRVLPADAPRFMVTMPPEMIAALDEIAAEEGVSRAEVVRGMVARALESQAQKVRAKR